MLDMSARQLERVIYYEDYVVIDPGQTPLQKTQLLNEAEYREAQDQYGENFRAGMGAEAIKELLSAVANWRTSPRNSKKRCSTPRASRSASGWPSA